MKYIFTDESVKRQITDSIIENIIDSDLESAFVYDYRCNFFDIKNDIENWGLFDFLDGNY